MCDAVFALVVDVYRDVGDLVCLARARNEVDVGQQLDEVFALVLRHTASNAHNGEIFAEWLAQPN